MPNERKACTTYAYSSGSKSFPAYSALKAVRNALVFCRRDYHRTTKIKVVEPSHPHVQLMYAASFYDFLIHCSFTVLEVQGLVMDLEAG